MPILHQQPKKPQQAPQSFSPLISTTLIDDEPFYRFCLAIDHHLTQFLAVPLQPLTILISTCEENMPWILRRTGWPQQNPYCNRSTTKNSNNTPNMQRKIGTWNGPIPEWQPIPPSNWLVENSPATKLSTKTTKAKNNQRSLLRLLTVNQMMLSWQWCKATHLQHFTSYADG